ncbi:MAG TPA: hypothetical protein VGL31_18740 [Xanthobacteraceae bacterium]|jgi:hypothetical protein
MPCRSLLGAIVLAALSVSTASGQIVDYSKYPDLKGQWNRFAVPGLFGQPSFDQSKPWGFGQEAPLTPEYKAILEASVADQATGGLGNGVDHVRCSAAGMPFMMVAFRPLEFIVMPDTTYILIADYDPLRRIFTDGRDWPKEIEPTFQGYSIGKWVDEDGDGRFDVLEVETRGFKGPRVYDITGLPLHRDNQSIFKERIYLDKADPNLLHDEITVIDHALTRPWTVDKKYVREADPRADWPESICPEYNAQIFIGKDNYYLSADGFLMPAKKGQAPPDLRYFNQPQK